MSPDPGPPLMDAGPGDAGSVDGGPVDAGPADAGIDAGPTEDDAGTPWTLFWDGGTDLPDGGPSPFIVAVISFNPGPGAGFGEAGLPEIVFGPPVGGGEYMGSTNVVSLGVEGEIVVELGQELLDGPGYDLTVFENPFVYGAGLIYQEPGAVAVSDDLVTWTEFPCDPDAGVVKDCGGMHPVLSNPDNGISPFDPTVSGGDPLDLADIGVTRARYVRIRDLGLGGHTAPTAGFDLDAIAELHTAN